MSIPSQAAARSCRTLLRQSPSLRFSPSTCFPQCKRTTPAAVGTRRWQSTEAPTAAPTNPKITQIVDQISQLTLLETADLVSSLKLCHVHAHWLVLDEILSMKSVGSAVANLRFSGIKSRLNIPDLPIGGFAAGPAAGGAAPAAAVEEEEAAPAAQEKTLFNLKLESFDAASKPKVIKEIKSLLSLSLVDSKKFVEGAPKLMKESVPKEEAEKIVKTMKDLGAKVVME
ncbi:conserved hypothetical protein [Histoplasma mississippiense (nom. inval.)]|uniref:putative mitochondrial 54S ribosomal protein MNP1 n=1 Tax=Ajellomyces capsulatus (strain NAm1 / WU24) TaxID=2059318 RepID=UPI000157B80B|nr:putative mitochondrial 54S ribosomal protein MNP1 [Histoplasma mississippiense (nom. inval.)]EDN03488.1 conserved hypothetical protein [Histoplasma mississippiense (nom. inval.)]